MKKILLQAALGQKTVKVPFWFMRQAGRYLPEYREIRSKHKTIDMFKSPSIASEITMQPLRRFNSLSGAILYADILLIPDSLGLSLSFVENEGPVFDKAIRTEQDIQEIEERVEFIEQWVQNLAYVAKTISLVKPQLADFQTMIGFAGAPFTVASYMIEGRSTKKNFLETKTFLFRYPKLFHRLMSVITKATISYLKMQIQAGCEVVQLFESWSGAIPASFYSEFCTPYLKTITAEIKKLCPVIVYMGEGAALYDEVEKISPSVFSVDWRQNFEQVCDRFSNTEISLQGNLDPMLLYAEKDLLELEASKCLNLGKNFKNGYIFNLGHGCLQTTPIDNVKLLSEIISQF